MNRNSFWVRVTVAVILVATAAVLGQIRRWQSRPFFNVQVENVHDMPAPVKRPQFRTRTHDESEPEVLVRFRAGVKLADIRKIASKNNDVVEDNYESVKGLVAIEDLDGADADAWRNSTRQ